MKMTTPKQVIVWRNDLKVRKGKIVSQTSHASLGAIMNYVKNNQCTFPEVVEEWLQGSHTKICVYVSSEQDLVDIAAKALIGNVNYHLVEDLGLTEFNGVETLTCLAIGPDYPEILDPLTGHLPLL